MTDRKLIHKFLKDFHVDISASEFSTEYHIIDKTTEKSFGVEEFRVIFDKIFGNYITDKKQLSVEIFHEWFKNKKIKSTKEVYQYLNTCSVELGLREWIIKDKTGRVIDLEMMKSKFFKLSPNILERCFNEWYTEAVIDYSEKQMNEYFK